MTSLADFRATTLDGADADLGSYLGQAVLVVNTASRCGLIPQYEGLQRLHEQYADRGFAVLGFPCNQFGEQEPGSADEIATFCSASYGVTFPLFEKNDVNGPDRQPLYDVLTPLADAEGNSGDIRWNFEKFLINRSGEPVQRFSPLVEPESDELINAIESLLDDK